ncbi:MULTISPECIES: sortase B protein-sorting domain-containing protein [unclassified Paenibacillus]
MSAGPVGSNDTASLGLLSVLFNACSLLTRMVKYG